MRSRAGGLPDNQRSPQQDGSDGNFVQQAGEGVEAAFTQGDPVLAYGG